MGAMKDSTQQSNLAEVLDISYHTINRISCEVFSVSVSVPRINLHLEF